MTFWPTKHINTCFVIANRVIFSRASGPKMAVLSLSIHVIAWCAVHSISAPAAFEQLFMLVPPIMLITMLPISIAGWGVREATMTVAFGYGGLEQADGDTIASLIFGATALVVCAIGGLISILSAEKASTQTDIEARGTSDG